MSGVFDVSDMVSYCLDISIPSDAYAVAQYSRNMASALGFSKHEIGMISIAVAEIATNVVRYALPGRASMKAICAGKGIEITIEDEGNGIEDIDAAMVDGFSTHTEPSIGKGLGAAARSVEELVFNKSDHSGTSITLRHFLKPVLDEFEVSVRSFPAVGAAVNHDQYMLKPFQAEKLLVVLSDFSEFGDRSSDYAEIFRAVVEVNYSDPLDTLLRKCQFALSEVGDKYLSQTLFMKVFSDRFEVIRSGNIGLYIDSELIPCRPSELSSVNNDTSESHPLIQRFPRQRGSTVLIHSDGICPPKDLNIKHDVSLEQQTRSLFNASARDDEDATLLVLRGEYER